MSDDSTASGYPTVEGLRTSPDSSVLRLTLDRPDRRNAMTDDMVTGLTALVEQASVGPEHCDVVSAITAGIRAVDVGRQLGPRLITAIQVRQ